MMAAYGAPRAVDSPPPYTRAAPAYSSATSSAASSLFSADVSESNVYEYGSKAATLSFSQHKRRGVRLPAYGRGGVVDGEVSLRSTSHVESVTVSLRGVIKTVIESSRRPTVTSTTVLLDQSHTIWSRQNQGDTPTPHLVPFSFLFPGDVKGQQAPLPPSFTGALAEGTVRVKYTVTAHVRLAGWRGNTTVETEVFYLPRPVEAVVSPVLPVLDTTIAPKESPYDTKIVGLPVNQSTAGKQTVSEVKAHLACPVSVTLSKDQPTPFSIYLSSSSQTAERLVSLVPHISVRLVRTITISARGLTTTEESTFSHGTIHTSDVRRETEGPTISITGSIPSSDTTWTSWTVLGVAKTSYTLRVTLPPSVQPELAYLDHSEPVVAVSGGYGSPETPDFSVVPSPAALLKKKIGYMPMRV